MERINSVDIVRNILDRAGIDDVSVMFRQGDLSDAYHPEKKTIYLSETIYRSNRIASAALAAHECGHAIQDVTTPLFHWLTKKRKNKWLRLLMYPLFTLLEVDASLIGIAELRQVLHPVQFEKAHKTLKALIYSSILGLFTYFAFIILSMYCVWTYLM